MNKDNNIEHSLCLIVPYFGPLPNFFSLFLNSCKNNPTVDWLFITDNNLNEDAPNIRVINMSFDDFNNRLKRKFDFYIVLENAYKLCDLKPAYGYIFEDEIKGFDFWGHCDVDLIFGNIRAFLDDSVFSNFDKILSWGHFSIYRNSHEVNRWFMTLPPIKPQYAYDKVFQFPENLAFDEFGGKKSWGGMIKMIRNKGIPIFDKMDFDDIRQTQWSFYSLRNIEGKPYTLKQLSKMPSYYSYDNGVLLRHILTPEGEDVSESLYVHFQKRSMKVTDGINNNNFVIVPNVFLPASTDLKEIWERSKYRRIYLPYIKRRFKNLIRKIKNFTKGVRYV